MLKVFGHLNPDTDSVCAAITYAWFLREHQAKEATPYILGPIAKEAAYVLERFGVQAPEVLTELTETDQVVIVDTNNPDELLPSVATASLKEIVDHHKLVGGLRSADPITVTLQPVAATTTIIWQKMQQAGVIEVPAHIAGLLLAAILSDTLKFTSPTTTDMDKEAAAELAELAEVRIEDLAAAMFAAKSDLTGMSARDLLTVDSKVFTCGDSKIRVSSLETTLPENALAMHEELVEDIQAMKVEEGLQGVFLFIIDIVKTEAHLLIPGDFEHDTAMKGFQSTIEDGIMHLPGVVSRKKQIVPVLERVLA